MNMGIDIGNTTMTGARLRPKTVRELFSIDGDQPFSKVKKVLKRHIDHRVKRVLICSVVPAQTRLMKRFLKTITSAEIDVVGETLQVDMVNKYQNQKQVGQDRLVGAYAARELYGQPLIVLDLGTAITFDVVNQNGEYDGGIIVPGIRLSAESLFKKKALLPRIDRIQAPRQLIGKNTRGSILSGLFYGYGAMCRGLIQDLKKEIKGNPAVILTGGYTQTMKKYMGSQPYILHKNLVFQGLSLLAEAEYHSSIKP